MNNRKRNRGKSGLEASFLNIDSFLQEIISSVTSTSAAATTTATCDKGGKNGINDAGTTTISDENNNHSTRTADCTVMTFTDGAKEAIDRCHKEFLKVLTYELVSIRDDNDDGERCTGKDIVIQALQALGMEDVSRRTIEYHKEQKKKLRRKQPPPPPTSQVEARSSSSPVKKRKKLKSSQMTSQELIDAQNRLLEEAKQKYSTTKS